MIVFGNFHFMEKCRPIAQDVLKKILSMWDKGVGPNGFVHVEIIRGNPVLGIPDSALFIRINDRTREIEVDYLPKAYQPKESSPNPNQ